MDNDINYSFVKINNILNNKITNYNDKIFQWGLIDTLIINKYKFNIEFSEMNIDKFLINLFNTEHVITDFNILNDFKIINTISFKKKKCSLLNLNLFDIFVENSIINDNGNSPITFSTAYNDIEIFDLYRETLINKESDNYNIIPKDIRNEFLFKLLLLISIGGPLNQFETNINEYKTFIKDLYKNIVSINCDKNINLVYLDTLFIKIKEINNNKIFNKEHIQNILYVVINKKDRECFIIFNKYNN